MLSIEDKIEQFRQMANDNEGNETAQAIIKDSMAEIGLEIIEELVSLNSQLCENAKIVSKQNDEVLKISKALQKEHKRIINEVLRVKKK